MSQINERIKGFTASAAINPYLRVKQSAADSTVSTAGPNDADVGITEDASLAANDFVSVLLANAGGTRKISCASICSVGDRLYSTTAGQVDTLASTGLGTAGAAIGKAQYIALEAAATAGAVIEALPIVGGSGGATGLLFDAVADSAAAGTSSTSEVFFGTNIYTIPSNTLKAGDILRLKARAVMTATHSTDTFLITLYLGGVTVVAVPAFDAANADEVLIQTDVVVKDIGATGHVKGFGIYNAGTPGTATARAFALASTAIDTTAANIIRGSVTVSVSDPGNAAVLRDLTVELIRQ